MSGWILRLILVLFTVTFQWWIQLQRLKEGGDRALYENQLLTWQFGGLFFFLKTEVFYVSSPIAA